MNQSKSMPFVRMVPMDRRNNMNFSSHQKRKMQSEHDILFIFFASLFLMRFKTCCTILDRVYSVRSPVSTYTMFSMLDGFFIFKRFIWNVTKTSTWSPFEKNAKNNLISKIHQIHYATLFSILICSVHCVVENFSLICYIWGGGGCSGGGVCVCLCVNIYIIYKYVLCIGLVLLKNQSGSHNKVSHWVVSATHNHTFSTMWCLPSADSIGFLCAKVSWPL